MVVAEFPFKEELIEENNKYILVKRIFSKNLSSKELVWHRDKEDREIKIIQGENWFIQFENNLPVLLENNKTLQIKKNTWHRIINKSKSDLEILLRKYK